MYSANITRSFRHISILALSLAVLAGCSSTASNDTFDLSINSGAAQTTQGQRSRQLLIAEPTAVKALDSENIVVRLSPSEMQYLAKSQWSDRLPKLVQSKLVEAFEDTGRFGGVGRPGQGLAIDYQVASEIRTFEVLTTSRQAVVELSVKLINDRNGSVRSQKVFRSVAPITGTENANYVKALDAAFAAAARDIVTWSITVL
jgi:cholesterol transport system auxiliary component